MIQIVPSDMHARKSHRLILEIIRAGAVTIGMRLIGQEQGKNTRGAPIQIPPGQAQLKHANKRTGVSVVKSWGKASAW